MKKILPILLIILAFIGPALATVPRQYLDSTSNNPGKAAGVDIANTFTATQTISAANLATDTTTGMKIGTATSQKLGFYNATPIVQPTGNVCTAMQNLGLVASCTESGGSGLTVGSTAIASGAATRILYDNAGTLGEYTVTGTGTVAAMQTSPVFTTPNLGTPSALVLTNATGTPTSIGLANGTGLPISTGVSGLGTGVAAFLATPSSANLATALTDGTGSGVAVFGTSPTFTTGVTINAGSIITDTTTGLKIATGTTQKLGFYNATPIVQPTGNICTAMTNLGLIASCTESGGMVYPGSGIANSTGSAWGTSYTTSGSGTVIALTATPTFTTNITDPLVIGGTGAASTLTLESTSGSGTTDAIIFKTGSQSERMRINTSGNIGIGTTAPQTLLEISENPNGSPATVAVASTPLQIVGVDGSGSGLELDSFGGNPFVQTMRQNGTLASPTTLVAGNTIFGFFGGGYNGTANSGNVVAFGLYSGGTWTNSSEPTYISFSTTGVNQTSRTERVRIDTTGNVGIGTSTPQVSLDDRTATDAAAVPVGTTGQEPTGLTGMVRFNSTTANYEGYDGSTWDDMSQKVSRVSSDQTKTSNTTLANVTGLSATLTSGKSYIIYIYLKYTAGASGGIKIGINGGAVTLTSSGVVNLTSDLSDTGFTNGSYATMTTMAATTDYGASAFPSDGIITVRGILTVGSTGGGTFIPQFAQSASNGTSTVIKVGSYMIVTPVP